MGLTRYEMETQINFNAEEEFAEIYTRDKSVMHKLDKLVENNSDVYNLIKQDDWGKTYKCSKHLIRFGKPQTEKQKEANKIRGQELAKLRINNAAQ